jgi:hypothetical protein
MLRKLFLAAALLLLPACVSPSGTASADGVLLRSGTSFGMCMGYCSTELQVTADELVFVERSRDPGQSPERTRRLPLSTAEWQEIASLVDPTRIARLPDVLGCPDCADGGAEYIQIEHSGVTHRVTFEYGDSIASIQPLLDKTRELRARFPR